MPCDQSASEARGNISGHSSSNPWKEARDAMFVLKSACAREARVPVVRYSSMMASGDEVP